MSTTSGWYRLEPGIYSHGDIIKAHYATVGEQRVGTSLCGVTDLIENPGIAPRCETCTEARRKVKSLHNGGSDLLQRTQG